MTKWTGADSEWQIEEELSSWPFTNVVSLAVSTSKPTAPNAAPANGGRTCPELKAKESSPANSLSSAQEPAPTNQSSPEKQSDVGRAFPLANRPPAKESSPDKKSHVAETPSSAKESCAAPTPPEPQPKAPSPATQAVPASNVSSSSLPSATQQRELQKAERAMAGALKGD